MVRLGDVVADLLQILTHGLVVAFLNDLLQMGELRLDIVELCRSARVEEDFLQQIVIFRQQSASYCHVTLECGAWSVLMLHDRCENKGAGKWD